MNPSLETTLQDFDYVLPEDLIAKYPLAERDQSRMMVLDRKTNKRSHFTFNQLPSLLNTGDIVVLNNARVIPARLQGHRQGHQGKVEIFLLNPLDADKRQWHVLMKPARRLQPGSVVILGEGFEATVEEKGDAGRGVVSLQWPEKQSLDEVLQSFGAMPIPPYLQRQAEALDNERYQTVFAKVDGAQAAPTAGLHFTPGVLDELKAKGVHLAEITLLVSAGTFRPVLTEDVTQHRMDPEFYTLSAEVADKIYTAKIQGNRVVAIGTTVAKTLETVAQIHQGNIKAHEGWSELFIYPGFQFQVVDALLTNFHLPKSTLMMLVSAFANREQIMAAYHEAVETKYRFYSYGDCMLIQ